MCNWQSDGASRINLSHFEHFLALLTFVNIFVRILLENLADTL